MSADRKCAHSACACSVQQGQSYCSPQCEQQARQGQHAQQAGQGGQMQAGGAASQAGRCNCGHAACQHA